MEGFWWNGVKFNGAPFFAAVQGSLERTYSGAFCSLAPYDDVLAEFGGNITYFLEQDLNSPDTFLPAIPTTLWVGVGAGYTYYDVKTNQLVPVPDTPQPQYVAAGGYIYVCCLENVCNKEGGTVGGKRNQFKVRKRSWHVHVLREVYVLHIQTHPWPVWCMRCASN